MLTSGGSDRQVKLLAPRLDLGLGLHGYLHALVKPNCFDQFGR